MPFADFMFRIRIQRLTVVAVGPSVVEAAVTAGLAARKAARWLESGNQ